MAIRFEKAPDEPIGLIQGMVPDSKEEWWVSLALDKYEVAYEYQWQIKGGSMRAGGLVVDFVVWNPRKTPFEVNGEYWHKNELSGGDLKDLIDIEEHFGVPPIIIWGDDAKTKEDVFAWVRKNVAN